MKPLSSLCSVICHVWCWWMISEFCHTECVVWGVRGSSRASEHWLCSPQFIHRPMTPVPAHMQHLSCADRLTERVHQPTHVVGLVLMISTPLSVRASVFSCYCEKTNNNNNNIWLKGSQSTDWWIFKLSAFRGQPPRCLSHSYSVLQSPLKLRGQQNPVFTTCGHRGRCSTNNTLLCFNFVSRNDVPATFFNHLVTFNRTEFLLF